MNLIQAQSSLLTIYFCPSEFQCLFLFIHFGCSVRSKYLSVQLDCRKVSRRTYQYLICNALMPYNFALFQKSGQNHCFNVWTEAYPLWFLLNCLQSAYSLESIWFLSQPARLQTTTLRYNKGLGPDEKRRTADSFIVNKPSVSPEKESPIGQFYSCWQITDWSVVEIQAIKIVTRHN